MNHTDIEKRLRAGESAEDIAKDFTTQLNAALAVINKEKDIQNDAQLTADSWNHFVQSFFAVNKIPKGFLIEDFMIKGNDIVKLLESFVKAVPALEKYSNTIEELKKNNIDKKINTTVTEFDKTLKDFFKKFDI